MPVRNEWFYVEFFQRLFFFIGCSWHNHVIVMDILLKLSSDGVLTEKIWKMKKFYHVENI